MPKLIDLTGRKFGRLTVVKRVENKCNSPRWLWQSEANKTHKKKHGMSETRIYKILTGMIKRCYNPNSSIWKYYGERGISVCEEWRSDFNSFYIGRKSNGKRSGRP